MNQVAERLQVTIQGGETVSTDAAFGLSVTVLGLVAERERITSRAGAKPGDLVYVSGPLGASDLGLKLLQNKEE